MASGNGNEISVPTNWPPALGANQGLLGANLAAEMGEVKHPILGDSRVLRHTLPW